MTQAPRRTGNGSGSTPSKTTSKTTGKTTSRSAGKPASRSDGDESGARRPAAARSEPRRRPSGRQVAAEASRQLVELTGKEPEGIIGLERTEDGWTVEVEVLELRRVPNTTDVLASYAVTMDEHGELEGYQRRARYVRGAAGED